MREKTRVGGGRVNKIFKDMPRGEEGGTEEEEGGWNRERK